MESLSLKGLEPPSEPRTIGNSVNEAKHVKGASVFSESRNGISALDLG